MKNPTKQIKIKVKSLTNRTDHIENIVLSFGGQVKELNESGKVN